MASLTLEQAKAILKKHTTEEHLFTHAAAVSAAMGAMAEHFGEDKAYWEAVGYLHDVDYEKYPDEHCKHVLDGMAVKSLKKKFKDQRFAAKCNRDVIKQGFAMLGMEAGDVMECCIKGMQAHKEELGF